METEMSSVNNAARAYDFAMPSSPLWDRVRTWVVQTFDRLGGEICMGPKLRRAFRDAGLASPVLRSQTIMAGPQTAPVWFLVNAVRGVLPAMEKLGLAAPADVDLATLEARLVADLTANDAAMIVVPGTAAWARVPA
jgi:hypothetical protein